MNNYLDNTKYLFAGTITALCGGFLIADYLRRRDAKAGEQEGCGCTHEFQTEARVTRGQEVYQSEMNQDVSGQANDLNRINPVEVGGAEDVYGAESFDTQYVNMNPMDYQTPTAFSNYSGYASQPFWDQANDYLP